MSVGMIAQHVVAIGLALGAAAWLIARTRSPKSKLEGPCATCAAASYRATGRAAKQATGEAAKRPDESRRPVIVFKK